MDWNNVNLERGYERDQNLLDGYDFDTLLLEVQCNVREINADTVRKQFEESLQSKIDTARDTFKSNLENIVAKAQEERNID